MPVLLPLLAQMHVDLVYFGIIMMLNSAAGLLLPPIGLGLFISAAISGGRVEVVSQAVVRFVIAIVADLVILLLVPGIMAPVPDLLTGHR